MKGYSLPFSPSGTSSLVKAPPWHFALDCLLVDYVAAPEVVRAFLPNPLTLDESAPGAVQIAICDGSAVSHADPGQASRSPAEVNYRECLIKLRCRFHGMSAWYVPIAWVTNDHSLLRGFLMGFSKRIGQVDLTHFHRLGGKAGGRYEGQSIGGRVTTSDGLSLHVSQRCVTARASLAPTPPFIARRHVPAMTPTSAADEWVQLMSRDAVMADIWEGPAEISFAAGASDIGGLLAFDGPAKATSFVTAFDVDGVQPLV